MNMPVWESTPYAIPPVPTSTPTSTHGTGFLKTMPPERITLIGGVALGSATLGAGLAMALPGKHYLIGAAAGLALATVGAYWVIGVALGNK